MERYRPSSSLLEPATYQISILGILDPKWSDYYGGMSIENVSNPKRSAMTILTEGLEPAASHGISICGEASLA